MPKTLERPQQPRQHLVQFARENLGGLDVLFRDGLHPHDPAGFDALLDDLELDEDEGEGEDQTIEDEAIEAHQAVIAGRRREKAVEAEREEFDRDNVGDRFAD